MNDKGMHRSIARAQGLKRYNTGRPCSKGHFADRSVANNTCCECARLRSLQNYHSMDTVTKELHSDNRKTYNTKNADKFRVYSKNSAARRKNRMPEWADRDAISEFYKRCPEGYDVDHIVPLQGRLVSGLHVLNNLQYLPSLDNRKKSNKFIVE